MKIDKLADLIFPVALLATIVATILLGLNPLEVAMTLVVVLSTTTLVTLLVVISSASSPPSSDDSVTTTKEEDSSKG